MYQYEQKSRPTGRSRRLEMHTGQRQEPVIQRHKFDAVYDFVWGRRAHSSDIPKIIHRFWAGGAMSRQSFENIMGMQERIKARNRADMLKLRSEKWVQILWTVRDINQLRTDGLDGQLDRLRASGVRVMDAGELLPHMAGITDMAEPGYMARVVGSMEDLRKEHPDFIDLKFLSDTVRLMAVSLHGGIYMDTDIGAGSVDLSEPLYHRDSDGTIPLAGVQVQNSQAYERQKRDGRFGPMPPELARSGITQEDWNLFQSTLIGFPKPVFNYFFASRPQNPRIVAAACRMLADPLESGMNVMDALFTDDDRPEEWMVQWLLDLQWATSASDMQEGT